jgi:hypothetical protein
MVMFNESPCDNVKEGPVLDKQRYSQAKLLAFTAEWCMVAQTSWVKIPSRR